MSPFSPFSPLNRRVTETNGTSKDFYYSDQWQLVEERHAGAVKIQYVWSPVYVDALVMRDRDTGGGSDLDERLYAVQDANWNVVAVTNPSGNVQERYVYEPYGKPTRLTAGWGTPGADTLAWVYLHQGGRYEAATGHVHFRNRDLSPAIGRWSIPDPSGFPAGDTNLYRYVTNNPTNRIDPAGLEAVKGSNTYGDWDMVQNPTQFAIPSGEAYHGSLTWITFKPNKDKVCCDHISFIQIARVTDENLKDNLERRKERIERMNAHWYFIDQDHDRQFGWYGALNDGKQYKYSDTLKESAVQPGSAPGPLKDAILFDRVSIRSHANKVRFEMLACAACREGKDANLMYGCLSWGTWIRADNTINHYVPESMDKPEDFRIDAIYWWNEQAAGNNAVPNAPGQVPLPTFQFVSP